MRLRLVAVLLAFGVAGALWASADGRPAGAREGQKSEAKPDTKTGDTKVPTYKADVAPLLSAACANCHSGAKRKGGVDVGSYDSLMKIVKANDPDKSRLVKSVTGSGAKLMPPKKGLAEAQVVILREWIKAGAKND